MPDFPGGEAPPTAHFPLSAVLPGAPTDYESEPPGLPYAVIRYASVAGLQETAVRVLAQGTAGITAEHPDAKGTFVYRWGDFNVVDNAPEAAERLFYNIKAEYDARFSLAPKETAATALPVSGPLPRPSSVDEAAVRLRAEAIPCSCDHVSFVTDEFTAVCPRTGQPDFCTVEIAYAPLGRGLESKSLKHYLWAFREHGAFCEDLAVRIAHDVADAIQPDEVTVTVRQKPRGGIALVARHTVTARYFTPGSPADPAGGP